MGLLSLIVTIAVVGFICWLILQIPMPQPFHKVIIAVVCVALVLWVLQQFGITTGFSSVRLR